MSDPTHTPNHKQPPTSSSADADAQEKLNLARAGMPKIISDLLTRAFCSDSADARLRAWFQICEQVARHTCNLLSSEYHARPEVIPALEKHLRPLHRKKDSLSFGDYIGAIRQYTQHLQGEWVVAEIAELVNGGMDAELVAAVTDLRLAKEGCETMTLTGHQLPTWVARERGNARREKGKVTVVLNQLVEFRNRHAHANPSAGYRNETQTAQPVERTAKTTQTNWWHEEPQFVAEVEALVGAATKALLLWPPMTKMLTSVETCAVGRYAGSGPTGGHRAVAQRRIPQSPASQPLGNSYVLSKRRLTQGEIVVVRKSLQKGEVLYLYDLKPFPVTRHDQDVARQQYQALYIHHLIDDGQVREDERAELRTKATIHDLNPGDTADIEGGVLARWCRAMTAFPAPAESMSKSAKTELRSWLDAAQDAPSALVSAQAHAVADMIEGAIMKDVRDVGAATVGRIRGMIGLDAATTLFLLLRLVERQRLKRLGSGADDGLADAVFQVIDVSSADRFQLAIEQANADVDSNQLVAGWALDLLDLTNKLLVEAGQTGRDKEIRQLVDKASPRDGSDEEIDDLTAAGTDVMQVGDRIFATKRLPPLLRRLGAFLEETNVAVTVPYTVGRTHYLINDKNEHKDGSVMGNEVPVTIDGRSLFFEANLPRAAGLYHIRQLLLSCGLEVDGELAAKDAMDAAPEESAVDDDGQTRSTRKSKEFSATQTDLDPGDDGNVGRGLRFSLDGQVFTVARQKVADFMKTVLQILIDHDKITDDALPVECGRVRYLLADAPIHRDDSTFERPVEVGGYFIETSHAFKPAADYTSRLLDKFGATDIEPVDTRTQLAVRLADGTLVKGRNAREFITGIMAALDERLLLDEVPLPFQIAGRTTRYFLSEDGSYPVKGGATRKMTSALKVKTGSRVIYAEIALGRPAALDWVLQLLRQVKCEVVASGVAALADDTSDNDSDGDSDSDGDGDGDGGANENGGLVLDDVDFGDDLNALVANNESGLPTQLASV